MHEIQLTNRKILLTKSLYFSSQVMTKKICFLNYPAICAERHLCLTCPYWKNLKLWFSYCETRVLQSPFY